jgi:hypothetical protein
MCWAGIVETYKTWRRGRYRRLIWGLIKRSLCWFLALLKPIVKVPEIVVALPALFELVKISKAIVVCTIILTLRLVGVKGLVYCFVVGSY